MTEPTPDQIARDYAKALAIIDNLRASKAEVLAALKIVRGLLLDDDRLVTENPKTFAAVDAAIEKAEGL